MIRAQRVLLTGWLVSCGSSALARDVAVSHTAELVAAIGAAKAGDVIILAPGSYPMTGARCSAAGTASAPIVVKSATPLGAKLQLDAVEGFVVTGPHWHFEGLDVTGVCAVDASCEHAFHVTGDAVGFVLRSSRVFDFNAQIKVNSTQVGGAWRTPHGGLVEGNEIADSRPRQTSSPIAKINIDTGDEWIVRANYLHDAHKAGGDGISYAAFMKSGGRSGLFERNLVICSRDDTTGGVRIGLSFGGGGTGAQFCAPAFDPAVPCSPEHTGGVMRNNIIVACSDVGIYLNKARDTKLLFNTLIATTGIDFRFSASSGEVDGNVLSGKIRAREGGTFIGRANLTDVTAFPSWYVSPTTGDLTRAGDLSSLLEKAEPRAEVSDDYCARPRDGTKLTLGALEHTLGDCATTRPPFDESAARDASAPEAEAGAGGAVDSGAAQARQDAGMSEVPMGELPRTPGGGPAARMDQGGCTSSSRSPDASWILLTLGLLLRRRARTALPNSQDTNSSRRK